MKQIREFKGYRSTAMFDPSSGRFAEVSERHPFADQLATGPAAATDQQTGPVALDSHAKLRRPPRSKQSASRADASHTPRNAERKRSALQTA